MPGKTRHVIVGWLGVVLLAWDEAAAAQVRDQRDTFDGQLLELRGFDPELATYLASGPRFTPGTHNVRLLVNGRYRGRVNARFSDQGSLCFDPALMEAAGLISEAEPRRAEQTGCRDFLADYPQSELELDPGTEQVQLIVPTQALRRDDNTPHLTGFETGGRAGVFNYQVAGLSSQFGGRASEYWSGRTELGFNLGDWIARSQQTTFWSNGSRRTQLQDAYLQRTFVDHASVLQVGQINVVNPALSSLPITGVQVFSEDALNNRGLVRQAQGIARTTARVEVYQSGRLLNSTIVPEGAFSIDVPEATGTSGTLQMVIVEADGERRELNLPALAVDQDDLAQGFVFGLGTLRDLGEQSSWVLSAGWRGSAFDRFNIGAGALTRGDQHMTGTGLSLRPWSGGTAQVWGRQSLGAEAKGLGLEIQLALSQRFATNWTGAFGYLRQNDRYRDFHETRERHSSPRSQGLYEQVSLSLGWQTGVMGSLGAGWNQSRLRNGQQTSRANLSWSTSYGNVSLSTGFDWTLQGPSRQGRLLHLSASIPLTPKRRPRSSLRNTPDGYRASVSMQERYSDALSYRLGTGQGTGDHVGQYTAGVSYRSDFAHTQMDLSRSDNGDSSFSSQVHGGVVLHDEGVTFSPYQVQDTFAVVTVGDLPGVSVQTPSGLVRTNSSGQVVVPQLQAYSDSRVSVDERSLPRTVSLNRSEAVVRAGRGSVSLLEFSASQIRRVLLTAVQEGGRSLANGATVTDDSGAYVTIVQGDGLVFLHDAQPARRYWVTQAGQPPCLLEFELANSPETTHYYESTSAVCRSM